MEKVNEILLKLAKLQASILINANAIDDDLSHSWQVLRDDYEDVKLIIDSYIIKGEE